MKKYHPDVNPSEAAKAQLITEAYNTLSNPQKRKDYDNELEYEAYSTHEAEAEAENDTEPEDTEPDTNAFSSFAENKEKEKRNKKKENIQAPKSRRAQFVMKPRGINAFLETQSDSIVYGQDGSPMKYNDIKRYEMLQEAMKNVLFLRKITYAAVGILAVSLGLVLEHVFYGQLRILDRMPFEVIYVLLACLAVFVLSIAISKMRKMVWGRLRYLKNEVLGTLDDPTYDEQKTFSAHGALR
jgi:hypothetical protein